MYSYSTVVSKRTIALFEAQSLGFVSNIITDKTLTKARFFVTKMQDGSEQFFPFSAISAFSNDAVVLKNTGKISSRYDLTPPFFYAPIRQEVYSHDGKYLGEVNDLILDASKIIALVVNGVEISPSKILSRSDEIIIINDGDEKIRLVPPVIEKSNAQTNQNQPTESSAPTPTATPLPQPESSEPVATPIVEPTVPKKGSVTVATMSDGDKNSGYSFLIGRTVAKDLVGLDGVVFASEGDEITENVITLAKNNDKLVQLALHSK